MSEEAMGSVEMARRVRALEEWAFGGSEEDEGRWEYPDGNPIPTEADGTMVAPEGGSANWPRRLRSFAAGAQGMAETGGSPEKGWLLMLARELREAAALVQVGGPGPEERELRTDPPAAAARSAALRQRFPHCHDCGLLYSDEGFADLILPNDVWRAISPTEDDGGLLCPTCIVRRATMAGLKGVPAVFRSGPFCVAEPAPVAAPPGGEPSEAAVEIIRAWWLERNIASGISYGDIRDLLARLAALPDSELHRALAAAETWQEVAEEAQRGMTRLVDELKEARAAPPVAAMPPAAAREVVWAYARVVERLDSDETADGSAAYRALEAEVDRLEAEIIAAMVRPALPVAREPVLEKYPGVNSLKPFIDLNLILEQKDALAGAPNALSILRTMDYDALPEAMRELVTEAEYRTAQMLDVPAVGGEPVLAPRYNEIPSGCMHDLEQAFVEHGMVRDDPPVHPTCPWRWPESKAVSFGPAAAAIQVIRKLAALLVEGEPVGYVYPAGLREIREDRSLRATPLHNMPFGAANVALYLRPQPAGAPELVTIRLDDTHTRDVAVADLAERYERQRVTLVEMNAEEARRDALAKGAPDGLRDWIVTAQRRAYGQEYRSALADVMREIDRAAPGQHGPPTAPSAEHGTVSVPGGLRELREKVEERLLDRTDSTPRMALGWVLAAIDDRLSASSGERIEVLREELEAAEKLKATLDLVDRRLSASSGERWERWISSEGLADLRIARPFRVYSESDEFSPHRVEVRVLPVTPEAQPLRWLWNGSTDGLRAWLGAAFGYGEGQVYFDFGNIQMKGLGTIPRGSWLEKVGDRVRVLPAQGEGGGQP